MNAEPYSVQKFIDEQAIRGIHRLVLLLCALVMSIDAFDVFVVGKIAPAIAAGFGVSPAALTLVFLMQQIGLAVGAFIATPLADRYGRQRMVAVCLASFGLITLLSPLARNLTELAVLRGLSGLFLSGVLPMAVALIAETIPRRRRGMYISIAFVAYSAGSAAGGLVAVYLLDTYGWQSAFVVGGALPLVLLPLVVFWLPESLPYLADRGTSPERIRAGMRRLDPHVAVAEGVVFQSGDRPRSSATTDYAILFDREHRITTLLLWLATFLSMGCIALLGAWLPTFFQQMAGIPIQRFAVYALIGFTGGLVGALTSGWLLDRIAATTVAPVYYLGLASSLALMGIVRFEAGMFVVIIVLLNFFQTGGQAILNTALSQVYPTRVRSTGIGWAGGVGRIGGVVLPLFGGFALASHFSIGTTMALVASIPMGVVLAMLALGAVPALKSRRGEGPREIRAPVD
jgi:MFS transporter, AAHS family, 4-hydroxybenzoate transporter